MNKIVLMGRLTRDPETRYSQSAEPVAVTRYGLAVNRRYKREGEPDADFINCTVFGKQGEFAQKYFRKGMMVAVSGRLQIRNWDDQQTGQKRTAAEVIVEEQDFAESKSSFEARNQGGYQAQAQSQGMPSTASNPAYQPQPDGFSAITESLDDDDLPF